MFMFFFAIVEDVFEISGKGFGDEDERSIV